jgi:hypothetical protein
VGDKNGRSKEDIRRSMKDTGRSEKGNIESEIKGNLKEIQEDHEWEIQRRYMEIHGRFRDIRNENFRR